MSASITKGSDPALSVGTRSSRIANADTTRTDGHSPNTPRVKSPNVTESRNASLELRKPNAEQLRSLEAEGVCSRHLHRKPCRACRGSGRR